MNCQCSVIAEMNRKIKQLEDAQSELSAYDAFASSLNLASDNLKSNLNLAVSQEFASPTMAKIELIPSQFTTVASVVRTKVSMELSELKNELQSALGEDNAFHEEERRKQEEASREGKHIVSNT